jgi:hypothetical protein
VEVVGAGSVVVVGGSVEVATTEVGGEVVARSGTNPVLVTSGTVVGGGGSAKCDVQAQRIVASAPTIILRRCMNGSLDRSTAGDGPRRSRVSARRTLDRGSS